MNNGRQSTIFYYRRKQISHYFCVIVRKNITGGLAEVLSTLYFEVDQSTCKTEARNFDFFTVYQHIWAAHVRNLMIDFQTVL